MSEDEAFSLGAKAWRSELAARKRWGQAVIADLGLAEFDARALRNYRRRIARATGASLDDIPSEADLWAYAYAERERRE